jgi:O-antigen/teichoic acid export membrane protein
VRPPESGGRVSPPRRIIWNTVFSAFSELSMLFTAAFFFLAANRLGREVWGRFNTAMGFTGLFAMLILFGFSYSITKIIVREPRRAGESVANALWLQAGLTLITLGLCYGAALLFREKYTLSFRLLLLLVFAAEALKSYTLTLRAAVKALGGFHHDTVAMNAERVVLLGVGGGLLIAGRGVFAAAAVFAVSRLISFLWLFFAVRRLCPGGYARPSASVSRALVSESWIYVVQSALWRVYDYIDGVLVSLLTVGFGPAGVYGIARKILESLWLVPNILTEATYPEIAGRHLVSREAVRTLLGRAMRYLTAAAFAVALGTVLMAKTVMAVFGPDYREGGVVLAVLGLAVVPSYLRYLFGNTLIAVNLQTREIAASAVRSVFNVAVNIVLIRRYGIVGAAAATAATDAFIVCLYWRILEKNGFVDRSQLAVLGKPFAALSLMAPVYWLLMRAHPVLQCAILLPLYAVLITAFGMFNRSELETLRKSLAGKAGKLFQVGKK